MRESIRACVGRKQRGRRDSRLGLLPRHPLAMSYRDDYRAGSGGGGYRQPQRAPAASYHDIDEAQFGSRGARDTGRDRRDYEDRSGRGGAPGGGYDRGYDRRDDYRREERRPAYEGGGSRRRDSRSRSPPPRRREDYNTSSRGESLLHSSPTLQQLTVYTPRADHRRSRSPPPSRYDSSHAPPSSRPAPPPRSDAGSARSQDPRDDDRVPAPRGERKDKVDKGKGKKRDERQVSAPIASADDAADVDAAEMARMMGFSGFDTTAVSCRLGAFERDERRADSFSLSQ